MSINSIKSKQVCWWSVTAFDEEIKMLKEKDGWPAFVKCVYGGEEKCPKTNRIHFQGALQLHKPQRLSALKRWLPRSHFEPANNVEALKKYAMKEDTAVGQKEVRVSDLKFYKLSDLVEKLVLIEYKTGESNFEVVFSKLIKEDPNVINYLDHKKLKYYYETHGHVFVKRILERAS